MGRQKADGIRLRREHKLLNELRVKHSRGAIRLFRNTVGAGFVGPHYWHGDGTVTVIRPQRITFGLCPGSSDLIGWRSRLITQADVGTRIAQFVAIEGKTPQGRTTFMQEGFIAQAAEAGAIAGVVRSEDDFLALLRAPKAPPGADKGGKP
jgi:hypothetical protein